MVEVLVVLASVLTALVGFFGVRYTARATKAAAEYTATLHAPEAISSGYDRLNEDLWRQVLDARAEESAVRRQYRAAVVYIRRLLLLLADAGVQPPEPPPELAEDVRVNGKAG